MPTRSSTEHSTGEPLLAESRRAAILEMLRSSGAVSVAEIQSRLSVSSMTARRDLAELDRRGLAQRTHGGAVIPAISAHEDSFTQRLEAATEAKTALAQAAVELLGPGQTVFIDSSTTSYFVVRAILERGVATTLLTNSLPVMQLVAGQAPLNVELVAVGGLLRALTQSFVGPHAVRTVQGHYTDFAFVSAKALMQGGVVADADPLEAEVKRAMISRAGQAVLLLDESKLSTRGLNAILPANELSLTLAYGFDQGQIQELAETGARVRSVEGRASSEQTA